MANWTDHELIRLCGMYPGWKIWVVWIMSRGQYEWCAMPATETTARLHAWSPDEMSEYIAEYESETANRSSVRVIPYGWVSGSC